MSRITSALFFGLILTSFGVPQVHAAAQGDGRVCVYQDSNYRGWEQCFNAGDEIYTFLLRRNAISSIRVFGARVTIYDEPEFRGPSVEFTSDVPDLARLTLSPGVSWNDRVESLRILSTSGRLGSDSAAQGVRRNGGVCVFRDINYQGWEQCYDIGDEIADLRSRNNNISSIRVYGRARIVVYEDREFTGNSDEFSSDVPDLGRRSMDGSRTWNDRIDSIEVVSDSRNSRRGRGYGNGNGNGNGNGR